MKAKTFFGRLLKFLFLFSFAWIGFLQPANAWNNVGHRAIAELAWRQMDEKERQGASELLKHHPHYQEFLIADVPNGVDTNEWAFLMAAIWPDWVRPAKHGQPPKSHSITKYDLYPHAIGFPFLREDDTNRALLENFFISKPNAEMVLADSIATLKNHKASAQDRAVSLAWVLHLFGDLHQPLHTASLVTKDQPKGGHLGGHCIVLDKNGKQTDLHSLWDQLAGVTPAYRSIAAVADNIESDPNLKPSSLKELQEHKTIDSWVQEGFQISTNFAYAKNHIQFVRKEEVESGKISTADIPKLSDDYVTEARKIAHRRIALAADRLTFVVKKVW